MTARLYDFGAITLALRVPADGLPWADFVALINEVDTAVGPEAPIAPGTPPWPRSPPPWPAPCANSPRPASRKITWSA